MAGIGQGGRDHGVERVEVPRATAGSRFTLLLEQAAPTSVREMPVLAAARIIGITDRRLWPIVEYDIGRTVARVDRQAANVVGFDETALSLTLTDWRCDVGRCPRCAAFRALPSRCSSRWDLGDGAGPNERAPQAAHPSMAAGA